MKSMFFSPGAKILVDILLIAGLIVAQKSSDTETMGIYWRSSHCILGILWSFLILIHVIQHHYFVRSLAKRKVFLRNKITGLTTLIFILMLLSILLFLVGFGSFSLKFHHVIGHLFALMIIIHVIDKAKRIIFLFKNKKTG